MTNSKDVVVTGVSTRRHLNAIGLSGVAELKKAQVADLAGVTDFDAAKGVAVFIELARSGKIWDREPSVTSAIR